MSFVGINNAVIEPHSTFIIGFPSKGFIGQLAVDTLLASLSAESRLIRLGCIESSALPAVTGYEVFPLSPKVLCLPVEVYQIRDTATIIIQQRVPCWKGKCHQWATELHSLLSLLKFSRVFVLTGGVGAPSVSPSGSRPNFFVPIPGRFASRDISLPASMGRQLQESYEMIPPQSFSSQSSSRPLAHSLGDNEAELYDALLYHSRDQLRAAALGLPFDEDTVGGAGAGAGAGTADVETHCPVGMSVSKWFIRVCLQASRQASADPNIETAEGAVGVEVRSVKEGDVFVLGSLCKEGGDTRGIAQRLAASLAIGMYILPVLEVAPSPSPAAVASSSLLLAEPVSATASVDTRSVLRAPLVEPVSWRNLFGPPLAAGVSMFL